MGSKKRKERDHNIRKYHIRHFLLELRWLLFDKSLPRQGSYSRKNHGYEKRKNHGYEKIRCVSPSYLISDSFLLCFQVEIKVVTCGLLPFARCVVGCLMFGSSWPTIRCHPWFLSTPIDLWLWIFKMLDLQFGIWWWKFLSIASISQGSSRSLVFHIFTQSYHLWILTKTSFWSSNI